MFVFIFESDQAVSVALVVRTMKFSLHWRVLVFLCCFGNAAGMYGKRSKGYKDDELSPGKRFRANLEDLFLSNQMSGQRAQNVFADGAAAGNGNFEPLAKAGKRGQAASKCHRDLMRKILKGTRWPELYWVQIPVWHPKTQKKWSQSQCSCLMN